jgi:hypothetical protein
MTGHGWDGGSPMDRMNEFTEGERAVMGFALVQAIHERGVATVDDFENGIRQINFNAAMFFARLHGGPKDGEEIRMPAKYKDFIGIPEPLRGLTPVEIDAIHLGEPVDPLPAMRHEYFRREGTPEPEPGGVADFDCNRSYEE